MRSHSERGVTLLELLIAVSLVAVLSTGMLLAMRTSVQTYEKTAQRLESNRRALGIQQVLAAQLSGAMAVTGICAVSGGPPVQISFFSGTESSLRLITSVSIAEGARGYPQMVEYRVLPSDHETVRLVATEHPYTGPQSTVPYCGAGIAPAAETAPQYVLADHLAYCRFTYHEPYDPTFAETEVSWVPLWNRPLLPEAVRVDMHSAGAPGGGLPQLGVTVPIRVTRDPLAQFEDHF